VSQDDAAIETFGLSHLLNVVIAQCTSILELLAGKDQALLVWWNAFLVLNLGLDIVNGVARLHLEGDSLAREGLDEDLHCDTSVLRVLMVIGGSYWLRFKMQSS
jgi:hypothetical protein